MRELASAIQGGDPEKVKDMIVRGAKVNHLFGFLGESGRLPLGWAAYVGHVKIMEMLIRAGADIEARDGSSTVHFPPPNLPREQSIRPGSPLVLWEIGLTFLS